MAHLEAPPPKLEAKDPGQTCFPSVPVGRQPGMDPLLVTLSFSPVKVGGRPFITISSSQVWPDSSILMMLNIHKVVGVSNSWAGLGVIESEMKKEASIAMDLVSKMMDGSYWEASWLDRII